MSHQQCRQNFDETEINGSGKTCYINSVDKLLMKQKSTAIEERVTSTVLIKSDETEINSSIFKVASLLKPCFVQN